MRRAGLCILIVLSALAMVGCGGSSSSSSTSPNATTSSASGSSSLTHSQLVSQANAICAQRNASIEALPRSLAKLSSLHGVDVYLGHLLAINGPLLAKLQALKPPAADAGVWMQAMADNKNVYRLMSRVMAAANAGSGAEVHQLLFVRLSPLNQRIRRAAIKLGLTSCLKQPMPSG